MPKQKSKDKPKSAYESLKPAEKIWVDTYLKTWNKTQASLVQKPTRKYNAADKHGRDTYERLRIQEAIRERIKEHAMSAEEALARMAMFARGSFYELVDFEHKDKLAEFLDAELPNSDVANHVNKLAVIDLQKAKESGAVNLIKELEQKVHYDDSGQVSHVETKAKIESPMKATEILLKAHGSLGAIGTKDDPVHTVQLSKEEWLEQANERRQQAEAKLAKRKT